MLVGVLVLVAVVARAPAAGSLRALVVFPLPGRSHSIVGHSIVDVLLEAGHDVTYVTAFPRTAPPARLRYVNVSDVIQAVSGRESLNLEKLALSPRPTSTLLQIGPTFTRRGLLHPAVQELLLDTSTGFDVIIAEWFFSGLLAPLSAVYECPLIWYSALDVSWLSLQLVHEASSPAYTADVQSRHVTSVPYSFGERVNQLWQQIYLGAWSFYQSKFVDEPAYLEIYDAALRARGRFPPPYPALTRNASLLLVNAHPPLGQRMPLPQSVQYVGGHHIQLPVPPLPENLKKLLDEAKNGAILFSMGSNLKSKNFPSSTKRELLEQLGQLEQTVLWKFEEQLEDLPSNVHVLEWAPQTSILAHPNTIVFISHGGQLSQLEAAQFGVPVVGIPMYGDQALNVDLAVGRGTTLRVDLALSCDFPRRLKEAVNQILGNYSFLQNAKEASLQFRSRVAPARAALLHWVTHVAATRGAPHLRSPVLSVPLYQRYYLDLIALILLAMYILYRLILNMIPKPINIAKKNK